MKTKPVGYKKDSISNDADVHIGSYNSLTTTTTTTSKCPVCKEVGDKSCQGCHNISYCSAEHQRQHWESHKPNCCPFILKENESLGRYLVASRKLPPGLFLIEESPLISGPRTESNGQHHMDEQNNVKETGPVCLSCYKKILSNGTSSYCLCAKCKWPVCGVGCAKAKQHAENECAHFAKNKIKYSPSILPLNILCRGIMLLRGLLKKSATDNSTWSTMMYLQHERVDKSDVFNLSPDIISKLKTYFKVPKLASDEEWNRVNRLIEVNAFSIERVEEENDEPSHATLLFHKSSLLAHACTPNCTWSVGYSPNFSMRVRTSKEIRKGEILTVSYNQPWNYYGTHRRTKMIQETGGFVCKCNRCQDPTELGTFSSGIKCKSGNCPGYLLPANTNNDNSMWKCTLAAECQNSLPGIVATSKIDSLENELSELQTIYMTVPMAGMKLFEYFIENNRDKVLHKNHWILQQARRIIINCHGSQLHCLQWDQLERFVSHCSELLAIWDKLAPGISLERGLYQMHLSRALYFQFQIKSEKLSTRCTAEKFTYLKKIHDLKSKALLYWKHDIQTKPLNEDMGYEANILQMEITNTLTQMAALS